MINFRQYPAMTKATIPNNIRLSSGNFSNSFYNMRNLVASNFNHSDVTSMYQTYWNCSNLTGSPVCGNNVTNMINTYSHCYNLTGSPVCGNKVTSMYRTYHNCSNLTGSPVCGNNVANMRQTYYSCYNLTGSPVCGENVTSMDYTYYNCYNLTGSPVCGNNVTSMYGTYYNCYNLANTGYFYSSKVNSVKNCFYKRDTSKQLSLYVPENSTTLTTCLTANSYSLVGQSITWTNDMTTNNCYYNTTYNIYIYPVNSVKEAYLSAEYDMLLVPTSYNDNHVDTVTMQPKTTWVYNAVEETIDNGCLVSTTIDTEQLIGVTINKVEVTV